MKKLISLLLALTMVFSLAICASAAEGDEGEGSTPAPSDPYNGKLDQTTTFTKEYLVKNGIAPAEDFEFEVDFEKYVTHDGETKTDDVAYPEVTLTKASFANAMEKKDDAYTATSTVSISKYAATDNVGLGVYTYKITEKAGTTAGVKYVAKPVYLVVTILRDEDNGQHFVAAIHYETDNGLKTGSTKNEYEAGSLSVDKTITGNMANMDDEFQFTVTLTAPAGTVLNSAISLDVAGVAGTVTVAADKKTATATFMLGHEDTATFTNIPAGVTYEVVENTPSDYKKIAEDYSDNTKAIANGDNDTVSFTNEKTAEVDTGITLDSMPFVLILAVCAGAAVLFVTKRRSVEF